MTGNTTGRAFARSRQNPPCSASQHAPRLPETQQNSSGRPDCRPHAAHDHGGTLWKAEAPLLSPHESGPPQPVAVTQAFPSGHLQGPPGAPDFRSRKVGHPHPVSTGAAVTQQHRHGSARAAAMHGRGPRPDVQGDGASPVACWRGPPSPSTAGAFWLRVTRALHTDRKWQVFLSRATFTAPLPA